MGGVNKGVRFWNSLFPDEEPVEEQEERSQGRDPELIAERNERLLHRLTWYKIMCPHWDYIYVKEQISREFLISVARITNILAEEENERNMVRLWKERPDDKDKDKDKEKYGRALRKYIDELKKRWWWMEWEKPRV